MRTAADGVARGDGDAGRSRPGAHEPARLAVMVSGRGSNLADLLDAIDGGRLRAQIVLVIGSRVCPALELARARGIAVEVVPGEIPAERLGALLRAYGVGYVALAGYLRLVHLPPGYERRVVNIHPALLPAFGGRGWYGTRVHAAVLASGARETGCTVHLCDDQYDHGPILLQRRCPVEPTDTVETLAARVRALEREAYPEALQRLIDQDQAAAELSATEHNGGTGG